MATTSRKTYTFTLTLKGADELTVEIADALYEAGCDDAFLHSRGETLYLEFDREAASLENAVASAKADVERAGLGLSVSGVAAAGAVTNETP